MCFTSIDRLTKDKIHWVTYVTNVNAYMVSNHEHDWSSVLNLSPNPGLNLGTQVQGIQFTFKMGCLQNLLFKLKIRTEMQQAALEILYYFLGYWYLMSMFVSMKQPDMTHTESYSTMHLSIHQFIFKFYDIIPACYSFGMKAQAQTQPSPSQAWPSAQGQAWVLASPISLKPSPSPRLKPKPGLAHH